MNKDELKLTWNHLNLFLDSDNKLTQQYMHFIAGTPKNTIAQWFNKEFNTDIEMISFDDLDSFLKHVKQEKLSNYEAIQEYIKYVIGNTGDGLDEALLKIYGLSKEVHNRINEYAYDESHSYGNYEIHMTYDSLVHLIMDIKEYL